jgi:lysyl-tRNA synthetase class 2
MSDSGNPKATYSNSTHKIEHIQKLAPKIFGLLTLIVGLIDLAMLTLPFTHELFIKRLSGLPGVVRGPAVLSTFAVSLGLILIADGLARRKQRAFAVASAMLIVVVINRVVLYQNDAIDLLRLALPLAILIALLASHSVFDAKPAPRSLRRAMTMTIYGGALTGLLSVAVVWMRLRELKQPWSWTTYFSDGVPGLVGIITPLTAADHIRSDMTYFALAGLGLGFIGSVFYIVLRSHKPEGLSGAEEAAKLRALYESSDGGNSLSYFALRDDKLMSWSPDGRACIVYRVELGVALAGGDPIGDEGSWAAAMREFVTFAHSYGWLVGVIAASEHAAELWAKHEGFTRLQMGDEAVVDTFAFSLVGRPMKNVRNAVTRAKRRGYEVDVHRLHELSSAEVIELDRLASEWRVGKTERGFSMALGRVDQARDPNVLAVRTFVDGTLHGFMTFVPWGSDGASLDFMRRHADASNGINELMLSEFIEWTKSNGVKRLSLNFTTFRKLLERGSSDESSPLTRLGRWGLLLASRYIQIETLHRFNAKFCPEWQPRYLVFESRREFLRAGLSALAAEGFL